jgi:hypothetical protein
MYVYIYIYMYMYVCMSPPSFELGVSCRVLLIRLYFV